jgi:hypothetical protein
MSYYLYLVETKKEYTIHLTNSLAPLIYEGIASIYHDARTNANDGEELKLFQGLLRKIPSWNNHLIEQETNRITKLSQKGDIIEDLIKAVIKSNIMILTNTPPEKKDNLRIKHDITTEKFIHNAYIEVARNIFQNPYLFYHKYESHQLKQNQRDSTDVIKKSIEQSIRKLLPMNIVLQNYLGSTFNDQTDDFQNPIPDSDYNNLRHMLNKDPPDDPYELVKKDLSKTDTGNKQQIQTHTQTQTQTQNGINILKNNNDVNVQLNTKSNKRKPDSSENFKTLKDLTKQNLGPIDNAINKIILEKTETAIKESEKNMSINKKTETAITAKSTKSIHKITDKSPNKSQNNSSHSQNNSTNNSINKHQTKLSKSLQTNSDSSSVKSNTQSTDEEKKLSNSDNKNDTSKLGRKKIEDKKQKVVDSEDASMSYFKQISTNNNYAEVYDNNKQNKHLIYSNATVSNSVKPINASKYAQKNQKTQQTGGNIISGNVKPITKSFINYNDMLDGDSSANLKSIMNDVSSINHDNLNANNKKKYFNKNTNL